MTTDTSIGRRARVLVVDDEPVNLAIVSQLLRDEYDVRVANRGRRALELATAAAPDLVLLDIDMPDLDGYHTCEALKALPGCVDVPVLFLTSRSDVTDEARGFEVGAVDYILKPISPPVLMARVRTHLALRRAIEDARAEKRRADEMLEVVLPRVAAEDLRKNGTVTPKRIEEAVVLFGDIVGFTAWCADRSPEEVVVALHQLFLALERIAHKWRVEKLKTIGDAFMAGAGLLTPLDDPLMAAIACGLEMAQEVPRHVPCWQLRVGVHVGPVVAGIVGGERFQFDVWGDTVNLAARLTSSGTPGRVCMTQATAQRVASRVEAVACGPRNLKGKGKIDVVEVVAIVDEPVLARASSAPPPLQLLPSA